MKVSVVVPTYSMDRYDDFAAAAERVLEQTYDDVELVVIVDGNREVYERALEDFGDREDTVVYGSHDDAGPLSRANMGAIQASGDIVALTDDDALPAHDWVENLVDTYERHPDAVAVGGRIEPLWVAGRADFIPEEFHFLIGATHRGFQDEEGEVRNTFGANLAFERDAYLRLGGIKQGGIDPDAVQGRETELCARMRRIYGTGVIYNPDAVVAHRIYDYRTDPKWLLRRAFWQGYSKRALEVLVPDAAGEETEFVSQLLLEFVPNRLTRIVAHDTRTEASKLVWLFLLFAATGFGYVYGLLRWR